MFDQSTELSDVHPDRCSLNISGLDQKNCSSSALCLYTQLISNRNATQTRSSDAKSHRSHIAPK